MARRRRPSHAAPRVPLSLWLSRRRRRRWVVIGVAALLLITLMTFRGGTRLEPAWLTADRVTIENVSDDLTLSVRSAEGDGRALVRLLGVARSGMQPDAAAWLREQTGGGVKLEIEPGLERDADGVWLVYIYDNQRRLLNEVMVQQGLAAVDAERAFRLRDWFERLERGAKAKGRGIWAS